ncbi:MAG: hypothetical protein M1409_08530 [Actinobacteria bacterium]|nr:hypothetical protein [Actinomycetota bacterium]
MIPLILKLRIKNRNQRRFGIWLPLFLLWLIVLPLLALLAPLVLLAALILWPGGKGRFVLHSYAVIFSLIFNLSGLKFDIESKDSIVYINLT